MVKAMTVRRIQMQRAQERIKLQAAILENQSKIQMLQDGIRDLRNKKMALMTRGTK